MLLLVRRAWTASGGVVVMLRDRSARSVRVLDAAAVMAEAKNAGLTVVCERTRAGSADLANWLREHLASRAVHLEIELATSGGPARRQQLEQLDCGLLVVEANSAEGSPDELRANFDRLECDLLIVR